MADKSGAQQRDKEEEEEDEEERSSPKNTTTTDDKDTTSSVEGSEESSSFAHLEGAKGLEMPLHERSQSAPNFLLRSLTASLASERSARAEAEKALKEEVEKERVARVEAEKRAAASAFLTRALSPFERLSLRWFARAVEAVRFPRPRCCCFGGPCFYFLILPFVLARLFANSPLAPAILDEDVTSANFSFSKVKKAAGVSQKKQRPALRFLHRASYGRAGCENKDDVNDVQNNHPVVIIPGMTSTALEVWRGQNCYDDATRQRVWSSGGSTATFLLDPECLQRHLAMNASNWEDPDSIRVRAASGLSSADAFGPLNLWGEFIVNLAMLGYDETSLALAAYDWRLDGTRLEKRDAYFTRLRRVIETLVETNCGRKAAILSHSLGSNHVLYFFNWIEHKKPGWTDKYVESLTTIGGAFLGAPKVLPYLISGEMTDTIQFGELFSTLSQYHGGLGRDAMLALTRSWGSVANLLPKGGDALWQTPAYRLAKPLPPPKDLLEGADGSALSIDDKESTPSPQEEEADQKEDPLLVMPMVEVADPWNSSKTIASFGPEGALRFMRKIAPHYLKLVDDEYDMRGSRPKDEENPQSDPRAWSNPLIAPLPVAPKLKLYCLYGVGRPTPRTARFAPLHNSKKPMEQPVCDNDSAECAERPDHESAFGDYDGSEDPASGPFSRFFEIAKKNGLLNTDGDGTVPLESLGYMCTHAWKSKRLNPAGLRVLTKEYPHQDLNAHDIVTRPFEVLQGLANDHDADHVTILGNKDLIGDLLDIVLGDTELKESFIVSDVCDLKNRVDHIKADDHSQDALDACPS